MLGASLIDIIQECARGKWLGNHIHLQRPRRHTDEHRIRATAQSGLNGWATASAEAGQYTFWIAAAVGIVTAIILHLGLKGGPPPEVKDKPSVLKNFVRGITEAKRNPRIALAYASGFISRGDLVVVGTFFSLWFVQAGVDQGMSTGQAMGRAAFLFGAVTFRFRPFAGRFSWTGSATG